MKSGSVVLIASILALTACSREVRKEKKCIEAKKKIVKLTLEVEEKLGELAPEKERWSRKELKKSIEARIDPDGKFVRTCMQEFSEDALDCINKSKKLSDLGRCTQKAAAAR